MPLIHYQKIKCNNKNKKRIHQLNKKYEYNKNKIMGGRKPKLK